MWLRPDLKMRGKAAFYRNYWPAVAAAFIIAISEGLLERIGSSRGRSGSRRYFSGYSGHSYYTHDERGLVNGLFAAVFTVAVLIMVLIFIILKIFIGNLLIVGGKRFFMENREYNSRVSAVMYGFKSGNYGNIVLTMFLKDLFIALWTLLFVIPGIIKSYEYRMVPYVLSENPGIDRRRAFEISKQMMYGQKMDTFIMDLSFIGWGVLSVITCGLFGVFFTAPYVEASFAELYAVFRVHAFHTGALTTNELPGFGGAYY